MQARSGGYPTAPAAPPVWRGVLRMRGLGLLAARHSLSTNNPQLMHKILRHRSRQGSYSSPCASQAAAPFARACWRWADLAGVVMLRPRRLERWGGLKVRPPKICVYVVSAKNCGGWVMILFAFVFYLPPTGGENSKKRGGNIKIFYMLLASSKRWLNRAPTCATVSGSGIR